MPRLFGIFGLALTVSNAFIRAVFRKYTAIVQRRILTAVLCIKPCEIKDFNIHQRWSITYICCCPSFKGDLVYIVCMVGLGELDVLD